MLNTNSQTNPEFSTQKTTTQYSKTALNFVLATGTFLFLKTTGTCWPLSVAGAEAAEAAGQTEEYDLNTDTQNPITLREGPIGQSQFSHHFQHRSLQQATPQSDTIIEGSIIGQLSLNDKITDYTVRDDIAYVTAGESGFHIIDVSNASNPITVGQYQTTGFAHQLQLDGNYTHIAYDLAGLRIVDVSNRTNPFLAGVYMMGDDLVKEAVTRTIVGDGVAVLGKPDSTELKAIDVSDLTQVFKVWHGTPGAAYAITISGSFAYVAASLAGLQIFDVNDLTNPQLISSYDTLGEAYGVTIVDALAYVADKRAGVQIIDVTNSTNPQLVGSCDTPGGAFDVAVVGNFAYVADWNSGVQIIDVTNSTNPQLVGNYDTHAVSAIVVDNGLAYVACGWGCGLQIIDVSNPANPQLLGSYNTPDEATSIALLNKIAYVGDTVAGLQIIDVSNPANPQLLGSYDTARTPKAITVVGNLAYVAASSAGLQIIDISNPTDPQLLDSYDTISEVWGVTIAESYAYAAISYSGLQIIDLNRNRASAKSAFSFDNHLHAVKLLIQNNALFLSIPTVGLTSVNKNDLYYHAYDTPGLALEVNVISNLAYVGEYLSGLQIIDISNSANSQLVGHYGNFNVKSVTVVGTLVYIAASYSGLKIIDVSNPTKPQFVGGFDTSGGAYSVTVVDIFAYVGGGSGLQIIDISNSANSQLVGSYDLPGGTDVTVIGNLAYVINGAGLQIIDLNIKPVQYIIASYDIRSYYARGVVIVDNLAYMPTADSGLHIINVSNPGNPKLVSKYDMRRTAYDVCVVGNLAYVANTGGLQIIDVSNSTSPQLIGGYNTLWALGVAVVDTFVYVANGPSGLQIIDVSNPTNPQLVSSYDTPGRANNVIVAGKLAYVADGPSGLQIIDISNPASPQLIANYNTTGYAYDVAVVGNLTYVTDISLGLQIIDISNPASPQLVGNSNALGKAHGIVIIDNFAYLADGTLGLQIIDVSNPANPQLICSYYLPGSAYSVTVVSNLAYVIYDGGLHIIDLNIIKPAPYILASYGTFGNFVIVDNLAYVADVTVGLQLIDVSNPTNPQLVSSYDTPSRANDVIVVDNLAYVADGGSGLQIIDTTNPTRPTIIQSFDTPGYAKAVDVFNKTVYIADYEAGLQIIELFFLENNVPTEGMASYMTAFGDILYLTDTHQNLYIIDITDPSNMKEISRYRLAFHALDIEFSENYLYIAQGIDGLEIIDVQDPKTPLQVLHNMTGIKDVRNLEINHNRLYITDMVGNVEIVELTQRRTTPVIINNQLIVNEGDYITVTSNDLSASNTQVPDGEITFIIEHVINGQFEHQSERDTIINRFTQQQLMDGEIRFASLSFNGITDPTVSYKIAATNGVQSPFYNATIDFNAKPYLINNHLSLSRGETVTITSKELSATDFDDNDADLRFEIFNIQHGEFRWKEGAPTQQFWQRNITDGLIQFVHDNSENMPSYQVSVYDKRMVVGNDTVRVVFDRTSFTEADNAPVITGGIIAGATGLGLLTLGLFAVGWHIDNARSRKKHPFADYLARELKLPGVENFDSPQGKTYLAAIALLNDALSEQGYDMTHMDEGAQKEWAGDIAAAAKHIITSETNCCGESKITAASLHARLQTEPADFVMRVLEYRLQSPDTPMQFTV